MLLEQVKKNTSSTLENCRSLFLKAALAICTDLVRWRTEYRFKGLKILSFSYSQAQEFIQEEHLHRHAAPGLSRVLLGALCSDPEVECLEGGCGAWVSHMAAEVPGGAAWEAGAASLLPDQGRGSRASRYAGDCGERSSGSRSRQCLGEASKLFHVWIWSITAS